MADFGAIATCQSSNTNTRKVLSAIWYKNKATQSDSSSAYIIMSSKNFRIDTPLLKCFNIDTTSGIVGITVDYTYFNIVIGNFPFRLLKLTDQSDYKVHFAKSSIQAFPQLSDPYTDNTGTSGDSTGGGKYPLIGGRHIIQVSEIT